MRGDRGGAQESKVYCAHESQRHRVLCRERHQDCEEAGVKGALKPWVFSGLPWKQQGKAG